MAVMGINEIGSKSILPIFFRIPKYFSFSIQTDESNTIFTLPLIEDGIYNFTINWGDGSTLGEVTSSNDTDKTHTYATAGTYIISMTGECTIFVFDQNPIEAAMVKELISVRDLGFESLSFSSCINMISIPTSFRNLSHLTTCDYMFYHCSSLEVIPPGIFDGLAEVESFVGAFEGCSSITEIPENLFRYNTLVTNFQSTFSGCTGLTTMPHAFFKYNSLVTNYLETFYNCENLTIDSDLFCEEEDLPNRFLDMSIDFTNCFYANNFYGTIGEAPDLWNCNFGTGTPTTTGCFLGVGNTTRFTNYANISTAWVE